MDKLLLFLLLGPFTTLLAQPIPPAAGGDARYVFTVYTPTTAAETVLWRTADTELTTHRARQLADSTEIRLVPARHTTLRTYVDLGGAAGAVDVGQAGEGVNIDELLAYDQLLSPAQRQLTESYLALKHGLTLDQTLPTNYLAADAATGDHYPVWTATAERDFRHRITGLAVDPASGLHRLEARSVLAPELLQLRWAEAPVGTAYFVVADDDEPTARAAYDPALPGLLPLQRRWRVQATGPVPPTEANFDPRRLFARPAPDESWVLLAEVDGESMIVAPATSSRERLTFPLPAGLSHFRLALRCSACTVPPTGADFVTYAQVAPNPVAAGSPVQLRAALRDRSGLEVTIYDAAGRRVSHQSLPPNTHHLTELTFPAAGVFALHLRPRLKGDVGQTVRVVVH